MPVSSSLHISFPTFPSCPLLLSIITIIHPFFSFFFTSASHPSISIYASAYFSTSTSTFRSLPALWIRYHVIEILTPPSSRSLFLYYHHHLLFSNITAAFTTALGFLNNSSSIHLVFSSRASGSRAFSLILHERTFTAPASR